MKSTMKILNYILSSPSVNKFLFYIRTPSPLGSKLKVIIWFLLRVFFRGLLRRKKRKFIEKFEKMILLSKMKDNAMFFNSIEEITNLYEIYEEKKQEKIKPQTPPHVILDIGAHIGVFSIKQAISNPSSIIYSIEPEVNNYLKLKSNIKLNKLKNVVPYRLAVLDKNKYIYLHINPFESGQHSVFGTGIKREKVRGVTLDFLRKNIIKDKIDFLKIDTEGSEFLILRGGIEVLKKDNPFVVIETHPWYDPEIQQKIVSFLKKFGYKVKIFRNDAPIIFGWK